MKITENVIKIISTVQRLGFFPVPSNDRELEYIAQEGRLHFQITQFSGGGVHAQLNWYQDDKNFAMVPFNIEEEPDSDCVSLDKLEETIMEYMGK